MRRTSPLLALHLSAAALAGSASAETITVCAKGCDHTSIVAALAAANAGDVIQLAAETYFEGQPIVTPDRPFTLRGSIDQHGDPASIIDAHHM